MKSIDIKFDDPYSGKPIHDYSFSMYEYIEEMDPHTFVKWCGLIDASLPEDELKIRAFLLFSRIDVVKLAIKVPTADPLEIFSQIFHLFEPLLNQRIITRDFLTGSKFNELKAYIGPGDYMANISFQQYGLADHSFILFLKQNNETDLNELCSALFTDETNFNPRNQSKNTAHFKGVSREIKLAILHNYWGLRNWQKSIWPMAFSEKQIETSEATEESSHPFLIDWDGISINIAESGVFGYKQIVDGSPVNDVLKFIHDRNLESKSRKKK
jgi:hypothetical protein